MNDILLQVNKDLCTFNLWVSHSGKSTLVKCMVETWPESYIKANSEFDSLRLMSRKRPLIFAKSLIAILPVLSLILIGASRPGLHWKDKYKSVADF